MPATMHVDGPIVVEAPKPVPPTLRYRAQAAGMDAVEYLRDVLGRHGRFEDAAKEMVVTTRTLRLWMRRFGIVVVRQ